MLRPGLSSRVNNFPGANGDDAGASQNKNKEGYDKT